MVVAGSIYRSDDGLEARFDLTDTAETVTVIYRGILPDLFSEGQGVVTQGRLLSDGTFQAEQVLAKHDETYMPPEVDDALEKAKKMGLQ
jgi:cytochrome c-type biogenesis protein CcmE